MRGVTASCPLSKLSRQPCIQRPVQEPLVESVTPSEVTQVAASTDKNKTLHPARLTRPRKPVKPQAVRAVLRLSRKSPQRGQTRHIVLSSPSSDVFLPSSGELNILRLTPERSWVESLHQCCVLKTVLAHGTTASCLSKTSCSLHSAPNSAGHVLSYSLFSSPQWMVPVGATITITAAVILTIIVISSVIMAIDIACRWLRA